MDSRSPRSTIFEVDTRSGIIMKPTFEFEKDSLFFVNDIVDPYSGYENSFNRAQCLNLTLNARLIYIPQYAEAAFNQISVTKNTTYPGFISILQGIQKCIA